MGRSPGTILKSKGSAHLDLSSLVADRDPHSIVLVHGPGFAVGGLSCDDVANDSLAQAIAIEARLGKLDNELLILLLGAIRILA